MLLPHPSLLKSSEQEKTNRFLIGLFLGGFIPKAQTKTAIETFDYFPRPDDTSY
jgi:hypothetical protein